MNHTASTTRTPSIVQDHSLARRLRERFDIFLDHRRLVFVIVALTLLAGLAYALFYPPTYEANVAIQVEDAERPSGNFPGDTTAALVGVKTPAAAETEILKSRMILGQAIENTKLYIDARPRYLPVIGPWMARNANALSNPNSMGLSGFVSGSERIQVAQFDVPAEFEGSRFTLTTDGKGGYTLSHPKLARQITGTVGASLDADLPGGRLHLLVAAISGRAGAQYVLVRESQQLVLMQLQTELRVIEKGKQSGVLDVSWKHSDPQKLAAVLNEIAHLYIRQNVDRRTEEAERTLGFLNTELPKFKRQLETSEDSYNQFRNQNGTISLDDEARNALSQTVDLQSKLLDARQRKLELSGRFTEEHPNVQMLNTQIANLERALGTVDQRIRRMPMLQQNTLRMQRDIKVNTDLYASLLNSSLQMRLAREGKVGNVRLLDEAIAPERPSWPRRFIVLAFSLVLGVFLGALAVLVRHAFARAVTNTNEIRSATGLSVYSAVPFSEQQRALATGTPGATAAARLLAESQPGDAAVEALRRLRTAVKFSMRTAPNNRVLISSATGGVGRSFVCANLAAVLAGAGRRVLVVDADLRGGHLHEYFKLAQPGGLSELAAGKLGADKLIHVNVVPRLDVLTSGLRPADPGELLAGDAMAQLLEELSSRYDVVLINTPPVLEADDAAALAPHAGTLLLVARSGLTQTGDINESAERLAQVGCAFDGVVLNALDASKRHYGSHGNQYVAYRYAVQPAMAGQNASASATTPRA